MKQTLSTGAVQLALYQPEIPHNVGSLMRLCACLSVPLHVIEPLGFIWTDRHLKRSAMDYRDFCILQRHADWSGFIARTSSRRILVTPHASHIFWDFVFAPGDILIMGRESDGLPEPVLESSPHRVVIPMAPHCRSLNMAMAASLVLGEALRQTIRTP